MEFTRRLYALLLGAINGLVLGSAFEFWRQFSSLKERLADLSDSNRTFEIDMVDPFYWYTVPTLVMILVVLACAAVFTIFPRLLRRTILFWLATGVLGFLIGFIAVVLGGAGRHPPLFEARGDILRFLGVIVAYQFLFGSILVLGKRAHTE
jgi:hypothetical protein